MKTYLEVGSLREREFTGIGETVCELVECALKEKDVDRYRFVIGGSEIHRDVMCEVVESHNGAALGSFIAGGFANAFELDPSKWNSGLFLHRVSMEKTFDSQAMIIYDLTPLICPQFHQPAVVADFRSNFIRETSSVDKLLTISQTVYDDLVTYFPELKHKSSVSLCGLTERDFDSSETLLPSSMEESPYFLCLGTLEPRKNNYLTLKMISENPDLHKSYRFVFVGKKGWGESFSNVIKQLNLEDAVRQGRIIFTGFVDENVKKTLLRNCQALIYPSHYEGFGLPVIEAFALGVPVICQPTTSLPEIAGSLPYYLEEPTTSAMLNAIRRCLSDRINPNSNYSGKYIEWAKKYTWADMWDKLNYITSQEQSII